MPGQAVKELFSEGLCSLYGAHQQGSAQAAANQRTSTSPKLRSMLKAGAKANLDQARRLEGVFASVGLRPHGNHDKAMQGIIDANNAVVARTRDPAARDLLNIELGQVAAHFYLATYGTLRTYAEASGNRAAVRLLQRTLDETGLIDREFSRLAGRLTSQSGSPGYGCETVPAATVAMHPAVAFATVLGLVAAAVALTGLPWPAKPASPPSPPR